MAARRIDFHRLISIYGRHRIERWEYMADDPHNTFQIWIGTMPEGCPDGAWFVSTTTGPEDPLVADDVESARTAMREEARRLVWLAGPGTWRKVEPA